MHFYERPSILCQVSDDYQFRVYTKQCKLELKFKNYVTLYAVPYLSIYSVMNIPIYKQ